MTHKKSEENHGEEGDMWRGGYAEIQSWMSWEIPEFRRELESTRER
jgi:hypothetical protein